MLELQSQFVDPLSADDITNAAEYLAGREIMARERLAQITLLGELDTSAEKLYQIGEAIRVLVRAWGPRRSSDRLRANYPLALADFLVAAGIHDYQHGDYWSQVRERTGLPDQVYAGRWGKAFEEIIETFELERFTALAGENSTRFVSRIVAHGGIPSYCLGDFFDRLLVPTVLKGEHRGRPPGEVIANWEGRASSFVGIDKPIRRFLVYGGQVAADLLGRCLEMAEMGLQGNAIPPASELGLSSRIVDAFTTWLARNATRTRAVHADTTRRLVRPILSYDPWAADALDLDLPPEPLDTTLGELAWSVTSAGWSRRIEVNPPPGDRSNTTRPSNLRLTSPFPLLDVALEHEDGLLRAWRFHGLTEVRPFLVFEPESGKLLDAGAGLPSRDVWIIVARSAELSVDRAGKLTPVPVREVMPAMAGGWAVYKGLHIDLAGCATLMVSQDNKAYRFEVVVAEDREQRPRLEGGDTSRIPVVGGDRSAFQGMPPNLRLPLPIRADMRFAPAGWRIRVRSLNGARPRLDATFLGDDSLLVTSPTDDHLLIDLASRDLLGPQPVGAFEVVARGPLGRDAHFDLLCLPPFSVEGLDRILVPGFRGPEATRLRLRTTSRLRVSAQVENSLVIAQRATGEFDLEIPPELDLVPIAFSGSDTDDDQPRVACTLPLKRVRWSIVGLEIVSPGLLDRPLVVSRDELEQADAPMLMVSVPGSDERISISLRLLDSADRELFLFAARPATKAGRFSLREVLDTVRQRTDAQLRLVATIGAADGTSVSTVVSNITRALRVSGFDVNDELAGAVRHVRLTWHEDQPVSDRVVRFWPLWRVWHDRPIEEPVPDNARNSFAFLKPRALLPAGAYRVEMAVKDPWVTGRAVRMPRPAESNCIDVTLGSDDERAEYIEELPEDEPRGILERFMATRDPSALDHLDQTLDPHEVADAVRVTLGFIESEEAAPLHDRETTALAMNVLRETLLNRPETLPTIADLSGFGADMDVQLRRLVVELGVLREPLKTALPALLSDRQRRALWHLWAPLFLTLDGDALHAKGEDVLAAAAVLLGEVAVGAANDEDGQQVHVLRVGMPYRFPGIELSWSIPQLRGIREMMAQIPAAALDDHAWTLANLDWLIRLLDDREAAARAKWWLDTCLHAAEADMRTLECQDVNAVDYVAKRWPTADHGPLRFVPFLVGATALAERAKAHGLLEHSAVLAEGARGHHSPREAFAAAPELYARDLCLMDALLLNAQGR